LQVLNTAQYYQSMYYFKLTSLK